MGEQVQAMCSVPLHAQDGAGKQPFHLQFASEGKTLSWEVALQEFNSGLSTAPHVPASPGMSPGDAGPDALHPPPQAGPHSTAAFPSL